MRHLVFALSFMTQLSAAELNGWPRWRGPFDNGVAIGDAPIEFSDTKNVVWKTKVAGRGFSSPVLWGDRIYLTTAIPLAEAPAPKEQSRRGPGGGAGAGVEHKFVVLCLSRKDGHVIWERTARMATPHEGYHFRYGSFASNNPVTDGKRVYTFFGSRGVFVFDMDGNPLWQKDYEPMRMRLAFVEGTAAEFAPGRARRSHWQADLEGGARRRERVVGSAGGRLQRKEATHYVGYQARAFLRSRDR